MPITDWDDAYANAPYIEGADAIAAAWPDRSAALHARHAPETHAYGDADRQVFDLYRPAGPALGLAVFVHGGYWQRFSGRDFAFVAEGALEAGFAVAMPTYTLAPAASVAGITGEIRQAITMAAGLIDGPVHLAGHSAGGHLVTRMVCADGLAAPFADRVARVLSISGVHDLRPLLRTAMAGPLGLTDALAEAESPALMRPATRAGIACVVGADERPEFLRQTDLLANIWTGLGADIRAIHMPGRHHFDIIDDLADRASALSRLWLDQRIS